MKTFKNYLLLGLMSIMGFSLMTACKETPEGPDGPDGPGGPDVTKDSVITFASESVAAPLAGGTCYMEYNISNPHDDASISVTTEEDWISDFNTQSAGVISFKVAANEATEGREGIVTVKYLYAEDATFIVSQGAKTSATFALENIDTTSDYFSYTVDIIPSDKKAPYIVMSASPAYIEELGGTDDDIYADDYAYFEWVGSFYGQSAVEIMQGRYKVGDNLGVTVGNATPGMTYIFYCYYVDYATGVRTSDIARFEITCGHPELTEVEFTMTTEVDGPGVFTDAVPVGFDGDYYTDVITAAELADGEAAGYTKEEYIKLWWANIVVALKADYSTSEIIAMNTCKGENADGTPRSQFSFELMQNTDYYFFAFALEENALCASTPKLQAFRTGAAEPSSNEFAISITELTARKAEVSVTATVAEDSYVTHCVTAADWATFGNNDAERMEHILSNLGLSYCYGNVDVTYTGLEPDTNYVLFAFGTRGGVPTTSLTYEEFATKSGDAGNATISFKDLGYFEVDDLEDYGLTFGESAKGQAIMPVEVVLSPEEHGDWWYDIYDWTGRNDEYDTQNYINGLLYQIEQHGSSTATRTYNILKWGNFYVRVAIIADTNGQYSDLYREEIVCKYEDARDPEEFVEWYEDWQASMMSSSVYSSKPAAKKMEVNLSAQPMAKRQKLSQQSVKREMMPVEADQIVATR